jgi:hypothetical protein
MNWLPYENYYMISPLSPGEVKSRVSEQVSPTFTGNFFENITKRYPAPFKGYVTNNEFKIVPVIVGRNSFIPYIKGKVESTDSGSRVHITMTLLEPIQIFIAIVFLFLAMAKFLTFFDAIKSNSFDPVILAPVGAILFVYIMMILGFTSESVSSKNFLLELLEAEYE